MNFSTKLKALRAEKNISQSKLASEIFVSRSAVAKWENGLGLPSEDSLSALANYFNVSAEDLLSDKETEQTMVNQAQTIEDQGKIIIGLVCTFGIVLFLLAYFAFPSLRDYLSLAALGILLIILGSFNIRGNIASIHWYNRRKVTKENQLPYCRLVGFGTMIIGIGMLISAVIQATVSILAGSSLMLFSVVIGIALMIYAQIKYNHGIF